jgi:hypothetical protein
MRVLFSVRSSTLTLMLLGSLGVVPRSPRATPSRMQIRPPFFCRSGVSSYRTCASSPNQSSSSDPAGRSGHRQISRKCESGSSVP